MNTNEIKKTIREEVIDEVLEMLWKLDAKYFDKELNAIRNEHRPLEEEYRYKGEAVAQMRFLIQEMR
jgi:hypothetical protein